MYDDIIRKDSNELCDPLASVRAPAQQELKIAERVGAYNAGNMVRSLALMSMKTSVANGRRIITMSANIEHVYPMCHPQRAIFLLNVYVVQKYNQYRLCGFLSVL